MTQLPHNPLIWVEDLPEDAKDIELAANCIDFSSETQDPYCTGGDLIYLPPGTWKLICLGNQATEEEAREIVEEDCRHCGGSGILVMIRAKAVCCGNYDRKGDCCGYPSAEPEPYQEQCHHCYATGKEIVDPSTYIESLASLITANGWKNPVFLRNINNPETT